MIKTKIGKVLRAKPSFGLNIIVSNKDVRVSSDMPIVICLPQNCTEINAMMISCCDSKHPNADELYVKQSHAAAENCEGLL